MQRTILAATIVVLLSAIPSPAVKTRQVTLPVGQSEVVEFGFPPSGYKQRTGKDAVSVKLVEGENSAEVTALVEGGKSQIEFSNSTGEGVLLSVDVVSDLDRTLAKLEDRLADFDDLELSKGDRKILVEGSIGTPAEWSKFNRILQFEDFAGKTESLVEYSVDKGTIAALRKEFEAAGFKLAAPGARPEKGQLGLEYQHNVLTMSGTVWSQKELVEALSILKRQSWLKIVDTPSDDAAFQPFAQAVGSIGVDDSLLELGLAFVVVSRSEVERRDAKYDLSLSAVWHGVKDFIVGGSSSQHGKQNDFTFNAGLGATLDFLAKNEFTREQQYGTIRFKASGGAGKTFHVGGTLKVTPPASGEGEAPAPQDFEYGFKVVNKGSRRTGENSAEADIVIEIKGEPYMPRPLPGTKELPVGTLSLKQETRTFDPTIPVPLGQTVAVAGFDHLLEQTVPPSGIPVLRNIPILSWFTSSKSNSKEEYSLLLLVSIRTVDVVGEAPMVPNSPMKDITYDANRSNRERIDEEYEKNKKFHGCWEPLNWFTW